MRTENNECTLFIPIQAETKICILLTVDIEIKKNIFNFSFPKTVLFILCSYEQVHDNWPWTNYNKDNLPK